MTEPGVKIKITGEFDGARKKTATTKLVPRAFLYNATKWSSQTVRYIKQRIRGGGGFFKRAPKEISQRLGYKVNRISTSSAALITIGTGTHVGREEVVYAKIQETGGWIFPKKARALTIPFPGVKGSASMYRGQSFILKSHKKGDGIIAMKSGKSGRGIKPLFLLRKNVKLPPTFWFSKSIGERLPFLQETLSEEAVWATASLMAYRKAEAAAAKAETGE
jgi:hypothetical protein